MNVLLSTLLTLSPDVAVRIEVIPHFLQSYDTTGDWRWQDKALVVYVSDLRSTRGLSTTLETLSDEHAS